MCLSKIFCYDYMLQAKINLKIGLNENIKYK